MKNISKKSADCGNFADQLNPIRYPRGVFKFKTFEQANRQREKFELEHALKD